MNESYRLHRMASFWKHFIQCDYKDWTHKTTSSVTINLNLVSFLILSHCEKYFPWKMFMKGKQITVKRREDAVQRRWWNIWKRIKSDIQFNSWINFMAYFCYCWVFWCKLIPYVHKQFYGQKVFHEKRFHFFHI